MYKVLGIALISFFTLSYAYGQQSHHMQMEAEHMDHQGHEGMGMQHEGMDMKSHSDKNLGVCPVMEGKAKEEYSYTYKDKAYYFCCPMCIGKFKENPEKYIDKVKNINMEAFQFGFEPERIIVNKGDIVKLVVTSRDVTHGVYIKEYGINVQIQKGQPKEIEFIADKKGTFPILCSVYCGKGHHQMKAEFIVEE